VAVFERQATHDRSKAAASYFTDFMAVSDSRSGQSWGPELLVRAFRGVELTAAEKAFLDHAQPGADAAMPP